MNFWYELDYYSRDYSAFGNGYSNVSKEMADAITILSNFYFSNQPISENNTFVNVIEKGRNNSNINNAVKLTSETVKEIVHHNFGSDLESESSKRLQEQSFIYFGQGILFDDIENNETPTKTRRPLEFMVHMMDGGVLFYTFWHFVINYYDIINLHNDNKFWTQLDKYIGLSTEIHYKQNPSQSQKPPGVNPNNPKIDEKTLEWLKTKWLMGEDIEETSAHLILLLEDFRKGKIKS
jgi:hypothetical protein